MIYNGCRVVLANYAASFLLHLQRRLPWLPYVFCGIILHQCESHQVFAPLPMRYAVDSSSRLIYVDFVSVDGSSAGWAVSNNNSEASPDLAYSG